MPNNPLVDRIINKNRELHGRLANDSRSSPEKLYDSLRAHDTHGRGAINLPLPETVCQQAGLPADAIDAVLEQGDGLLWSWDRKNGRVFLYSLKRIRREAELIKS